MRSTTEQPKPTETPSQLRHNYALKLERLTLHNFKGATDFILNPNGNDISIYGDNATGKTTLADAFYWCLFGKDSLNSSDFDLKTIDNETGNEIAQLQHSVVLELSKGDQRFKFSRCYAEDYKTSRGKLDKEFAGHSTKYHLNDVPLKKKDYDAAVSDLCDPSQFRMLTDPTHSHRAMHWNELRALLLEVCGDVSDADVIASNTELFDLTEIIGGRSLADHREIATEKRKLIKDERAGIPLRIDEVNRGAPEQDVPGAVAYNLAALRAELNERTKEAATIATGGGVAEKTVELREIEGRAQDVLNTINSERGAANVESFKEYNAATLARDIASELVDKLGRRMDDKVEESARLDKWLEVKIEAYTVEDIKEFTYTGALECPACERALDADLIAEARTKAESEFNLSKSGKLTELMDEGKRGREKSNAINEQIDHLGKEIEKAQADRDTKFEAIPKSPGAKSQTDPEEDERYKVVISEAQTVKDEIETLTLGNEGALDDLRTTMAMIQSQITLGEQVAASALQRKRADERVAELGASEKKLSAEYESLSREMFLADEFIRTKVSFLTDRINSRFTHARFKLFDNLIGGGIEECCVATYKGVPYGSLNHGSRLNVGLDIINTLTEHYQFAPPVFIDNAESVTRIIPTAGQQVRLVVSASDKVLRTEQVGI